jgi:hypothetical protein
VRILGKVVMSSGGAGGTGAESARLLGVEVTMSPRRLFISPAMGRFYVTGAEFNVDGGRSVWDAG